MCRRELIFFGVIFLWLLVISVEVIWFIDVANKYGVLVNLLPIVLLFLAIIPRYFSKKYNNWLETNVF